MPRPIGHLQQRLLDMLAARQGGTMTARGMAEQILDEDHPHDLEDLNRHRASVVEAVRVALHALAKRKLVRLVGRHGQGHRRSLTVWALVSEAERPRTVQVRVGRTTEAPTYWPKGH
jgi:hypothetical protein